MNGYGNFASPEHAVLTGSLFGLLMKCGLGVSPEIDEDGNYTDVIEIGNLGTTLRVQVLPPYTDTIDGEDEEEESHD